MHRPLTVGGVAVAVGSAHPELAARQLDELDVDTAVRPHRLFDPRRRRFVRRRTTCAHRRQLGTGAKTATDAIRSQSTTTGKVPHMTTKITDSGHSSREADAVDDGPVVATGVTPERLANLRVWNIGLTILHAAQAVLIVVMSGDFVIQVVSTFPEGPPGTRVPTPNRSSTFASASPSGCSWRSPRSTTWSPRPSVAPPTRTTCAAASTGSAGSSTRSAPRS